MWETVKEPVPVSQYRSVELSSSLGSSGWALGQLEALVYVVPDVSFWP